MNSFVLFTLVSLGAHAGSVPGPLEQNAPLVIFHPDELYAALDPFEFLSFAHLYQDGKDIGPAPRVLSTLSENHFVATARPLAHSPSAAPTLWKEGASPFLTRWKAQDLAGSWRMIEYWFHYPYNAAHIWFGLGDHQGDWEGISVLLRDSKIIAAYYSQHKSGTWYCAAELETTAGGHPVVFSAEGSHASFPHAGHYPRASRWIGEDVAAPGQELQSWHEIRPLEQELYYGFKGDWGKPAFLRWNAPPKVPHRSNKFLPRDRDSELIEKMIADVRKRCSVH